MSADKKKTLFVEATQLIKHGKYGQASKVLKDLLALEPSKIEFRRLSASLNLKLGNMMAAKGAYEELVQDALSMRDPHMAESMLREYLAAGPRCVPFLELLGKICEDNGNAMVAANEYSKALQILLDDPDAGDAGAPDQLFRKIKELAPNNPVLTQYASQFEKTQALRVSAAALDQTTKLDVPTDATIKFDTAGLDKTTKLDVSAMQPAAPVSPLETTLKMKAMKAAALAAPPPAAPPVPPPIAAPPPSPPPVAAAPPPPPPPAALSPPPVVAPPRPVAAPVVPPPSAEDMPLVEDDITELISKPIPKLTEMPVEKPSVVSRLLNLFQSQPSTPESAAPAHETAAPAPESAQPGKSWQPWQPEAAPTASPLPPPISPTAEPQGKPWQPWQPEPDASAPAPTAMKISEASAPAVKPPKKAKPARQEKGPSLSISGGVGHSVSLGEAAQAAKRRPVALPQVGPSRRTKAIMAMLRKTAIVVAVPVGLALLTYIGLAVASLALEQGPSEAYQNLSGAPPRSGQDPQRNAYVFLLGFGTDPTRDPMADGFDRMEKTEGVRQPQCGTEPDPASGPLRFSVGTGLVDTAWQSADPIGQFTAEAPRVQALANQHAPLMNRYRELMAMKITDEGFGKMAVPNCTLILTAHRMYVAEGFGQNLMKGIERLKQDAAFWRPALSQARTLPVKQLALSAFNDDLTVLAGLINRPDVDAAIISDLATLAKPLEQFERSLRWPMQNALAIDAKLLKTSAIFDAVEHPTLMVQLLAHLPLPNQRILNRYAEYYEAMLKSSDSPLAPPPKLYQFAKTPPRSPKDYVMNPVDNLVPGRMPGAWDEHVGTVIETDARLRLVALVTLLRGLPRDMVLARIAQAGSAYYDPFMEITMLMDTPKGKLYSVGKNRADDDADPILDVTVPFTPKEPPPAKVKKR